MAKPVLTLALIATDTAAIDVSAATSRNGVYDEQQGYNGADWCIFDNPGNYITKRQNYQTCIPVEFHDTGAAPGTTGGFGDNNAIYFTADQLDGDVTPGMQSSTTGLRAYNFAASQANCGVKYDIPATADLQSFFFRGTIFDAGATWRVSALLTDGSAAPPVTIDLPVGGKAWFRCDFRSLPPGARLQIDVRRVGAPATVSTFSPRLSYTTVPIPRKLPRRWAIHRRMTHVLGA
jgi:hypothetical protein